MKPRFRLSVCKGTDCRSRGANAVFTTAQSEVASQGTAADCRVDRGGCYGLCNMGPNVVVRPDDGRPRDAFSRENYQLVGTPGEVHYAAMTPEQVVEVVRRLAKREEPAPVTWAPALAAGGSSKG